VGEREPPRFIILWSVVTEAWTVSKMIACVVNLPFHHRDPFDRVAVAQALQDELANRFRRSRASKIWRDRDLVTTTGEDATRCPSSLGSSAARAGSPNPAQVLVERIEPGAVEGAAGALGCGCGRRSISPARRQPLTGRCWAGRTPQC
jgi:hypothetical protein